MFSLTNRVRKIRTRHSGRWVLSPAVVVFAASLLGCAAKPNPQAEAQLRTVYAAYNTGDDAETIHRADKFLAIKPSTFRSAEAYYLRGLARYRQGQYTAARSDFDAALRFAEHPQTRLPILVALGDLDYQTNHLAQAGNTYRQALELCSPAEAPADHAYYRLGCVYQMLGHWNDADVQFNKIMEFFPEMPLTTLARRRVHCRAWTVQAGSFDRKHNADLLATRLKKEDFSAGVEPALQEGRLRYVVSVGHFSQYDQARNLLESVRKISPNAFVFVTR